MHQVMITNVNANENREEWLALRRQHLTATDWPKITGTSRWGSAEEVIFDKLNTEDDDYFEPNLPMKVGSALEPLIIDKTKKVLGRGSYLSQAFLSRRHMGFTPDLIRIHKSSDWVLAEIKVSVKEWGGNVPADYLDQVRFQATVLGIDQVHVIHLKLPSWKDGLRLFKSGNIPQDRLAVYLVDVSETERKRIERQSAKWWNTNIMNGD